MRSKGLLWPGIAALALGLGLLAFPGHSIAQPSDREDDTDSLEKKVIRLYTQEAEEDAGEAAKGGYLGVQVQDLTRRLKRAMDIEGVDGALVNRVEEDSPADRSGIRKGDVIVRVGRTDTPDAAELTRAVRRMKPDEKTSVVVVRDGQRKTLTVVLGNRPKTQDYEFELPDGGSFHWDGSAPSAGRIFMQQNQDMKDQLEQLRDEISKLRDEIRELRLEMQRRPTRSR